MKVCFIGACGHWWQAYEVLKSRENVKFVGFAPGDAAEKMNSSCREDIPFFADYMSMLDEVKPKLAVVSPVFGKTGEVIIECAKRGIDVFAEKPVASSIGELETVKKAVSASGIRFSAMHYLRFDPAFYRAAQLVHDGAVGNIRLITAQKSYKYGVRPEWYHDRKLYGGTIPWVGIHAIDWIFDFTGKRFVSVTAKSIGDSPEMAAVCQLELEGEIIASVNIDYYRPPAASTHGDDRVRCVGDKGVIEVMDGKITLINGDGKSEIIPDADGVPELFDRFLDGDDIISADEIFHITEAAICARESAYSGKTLRIGEHK